MIVMNECNYVYTLYLLTLLSDTSIVYVYTVLKYILRKEM